MRNLRGKVAVVTGAASGIGLATSRLLASRGMQLVLADIDATRLNAAAVHCRIEADHVLPVETDVSSLDAMRHLADAAYGTFGDVHVLHLNAGIGSGASLFDDDADRWGRAIGVNLLGVVWGIKAFVPRMIDAGEEGVVLATSSGAGTDGTSYNQPAYAATKAAVLTVMECLYGQLRDRGSSLRAGVVFPPLTATNLAGSPEMMHTVEAHLRAQGVPATLVQPEAVALMILDGIERDRFFIRAGAAESEAIFGGAISADYLTWNEGVVRGRADAQLSDGVPDGYLW